MAFEGLVQWTQAVVDLSVLEPFDDPAWVFETKWDGFRMVTNPRRVISGQMRGVLITV